MMCKEEFLEKLEQVGHVLIRDEDGEIDMFALDYNYHNGPMCSICKDCWCIHCQKNDTEIEPCSGDKNL